LHTEKDTQSVRLKVDTRGMLWGIIIDEINPPKEVVILRDVAVTMVHTYGLQPIVRTDSRMRNITYSNCYRQIIINDTNKKME
jgi:hypothetical protein